jgi:hypothetical protein
MFWNRNKSEYDIVVVDLSNKSHNLRVKAEVTPEEILRDLNIQNAYLILEGIFMTPRYLKKLLRDGSTFYACPIEDKG